MKFLCLAAAACVFSGCAGTQLDRIAFDRNDPAARAVVRDAASAQGARVPAQVTVALDGDWYSLVTKLQPELTDVAFRKASVETYRLREGVVRQRHTAAGGTKEVLRSRDGVTVRYNGAESTNATARAAAALVADAYTMFLFGPAWFLNQANTTWRMVPGRVTVDGVACVQVAVRVRPGLGFSGEDRALLSLDAETKRLKRVFFTLNGLDSTRGAEVDVTFGGHVRRGGFEWPTEYFERVRSPLRIPAHRWRATAITVP